MIRHIVLLAAMETVLGAAALHIGTPQADGEILVLFPKNQDPIKSSHGATHVPISETTADANNGVHTPETIRESRLGTKKVIDSAGRHTWKQGRQAMAPWQINDSDNNTKNIPIRIAKALRHGTKMEKFAVQRDSQSNEDNSEDNSEDDNEDAATPPLPIKKNPLGYDTEPLPCIQSEELLPKKKDQDSEEKENQQNPETQQEQVAEEEPEHEEELDADSLIKKQTKEISEINEELLRLLNKKRTGLLHRRTPQSNVAVHPQPIGYFYRRSFI